MNDENSESDDEPVESNSSTESSPHRDPHWWPLEVEPDGYVSRFPNPDEWFADCEEGYPKDFPLREVWAARSLAECLFSLDLLAGDPPGKDDLEIHDYEEINYFKECNRDMRTLFDLPMIGTDYSMSDYEKFTRSFYPPSGVLVCNKRFTCVANAVKYFALNLRMKLYPYRVDSAVFPRDIGTLDEFSPADPYSRRSLNGLWSWSQSHDSSHEEINELQIAIQHELCRIVEAYDGDVPLTAQAKRAPRGRTGRRASPEKQKHADRANQLRSEDPQKEWKQCASIVNSEFQLTGASKYDKNSIRNIWRVKCGDKKKRD